MSVSDVQTRLCDIGTRVPIVENGIDARLFLIRTRDLIPLACLVTSSLFRGGRHPEALLARGRRASEVVVMATDEEMLSSLAALQLSPESPVRIRCWGVPLVRRLQ